MTNADGKILLEEINKSKFRRDAFEVEFIQSVTRRLAGGEALSFKQAKVLNKIYRKSQGGSA